MLSRGLLEASSAIPRAFCLNCIHAISPTGLYANHMGLLHAHPSTDLDSSTNCTSEGVAAQLRFAHKKKSGYFQNLRAVLREEEASSRHSKEVQGEKEGTVSTVFRLHV